MGAAILAALANVVWIIALKDYSYAVLTGPIAAIGFLCLLMATTIRRRLWPFVMVPCFAIPFLPWVDWMYGQKVHPHIHR